MKFPVFHALEQRRRCEMGSETKERIAPEKAIALLKADGIEVNNEQAKIILDFLYEMAEIVVDTYFKQQEDP